MMSTPEAKLESEPCKAKPTARPAAPMTATNEAVCTPMRLSAAISTKAKMAYFTRLPMKSVMVESRFRAFISRTMPLVSRLAASQPMTSVSRAAAILTPYSMSRV